MVDVPLWAEAALVAASTFAASLLAYGFAIRTSRKERHYDIKVREYGLLLESLASLLRSLQAMHLAESYEPKKDKTPDQTVLLLGGAAALVFSADEMKEMMLDAGSKLQKSKFKTERAGWKFLCAHLAEEITAKGALNLIQHGNQIQAAAVRLEIIRSTAVKGPNAKALVGTLQELAFASLAIELDPQSAEAMQPKVLELLAKMAQHAKALETEIQAEISGTL